MKYFRAQPTLSQFYSFKIGRSASFMQCRRVVQQTFKPQNCERVGWVQYNFSCKTWPCISHTFICIWRLRNSSLCRSETSFAHFLFCYSTSRVLEFSGQDSCCRRVIMFGYLKQRGKCISAEGKCILVEGKLYLWPKPPTRFNQMKTTSIGLEFPDEPFHNFRASKSVHRRILCCTGTSCDGF